MSSLHINQTQNSLKMTLTLFFKTERSLRQWLKTACFLVLLSSPWLPSSSPSQNGNRWNTSGLYIWKLYLFSTSIHKILWQIYSVQTVLFIYIFMKTSFLLVHRRLWKSWAISQESQAGASTTSLTWYSHILFDPVLSEHGVVLSLFTVDFVS